MPDDAGFTAQFATDNASEPPIWIDDLAWQEDAIPVRDWVAPGYFLRGAVTAVVGPPAVSKSSLMLAYAVALALGMNLHGMRPRGPCRVMIFNAEDDQEEQRRRLSAILTSRGRTPEHVAGRIIRLGPSRAATLLVRDEDTDELLSTPALTALVEAVQAYQPDVLILDPLSELHSEEENANVAMREVVAWFRTMARQHHLALTLVHHTRKGLVVPGDMDSGRGASSISGAARIMLTLTGMTEDEAKAFGLPAESRRHFFRLDGAKSNYAPLSEAEWFERCQRELANRDTVAVPEPWAPPQDAITIEVQTKVEAAVRRGHVTGPLSVQLGNTPRSIKHAMVDAGISTMTGQKAMLEKLFQSGFQQLRFRDVRRKWVGGIRAPDGLPEADWEGEEHGDEAA